MSFTLVLLISVYVCARMKVNNTTRFYTVNETFDYWTDWVDGKSDGITDSDAGAQDLFGPLDLTPAICTNPNANNKCGLGYLYDYDAGAVVRGGIWFNYAGSGVFAAGLDGGPSDSYDVIGFRCVYHP